MVPLQIFLTHFKCVLYTLRLFYTVLNSFISWAFSKIVTFVHYLKLVCYVNNCWSLSKNANYCRSVPEMFPVSSVHSFLDKLDWNAEELTNVLRQDSSSVNECPIACDPPLVRALKSEKCSQDIVRLLLDYGADVNCKLPHFYSPLLVAVRSSRSEPIVRELLKRGADVHILDKYGQSCICNALQVSAPLNILKLLLEAGCSPNTCEDHVSVLHCASVSPRAVLDKDKLQLLLEAGADFHRFGTWEKRGRSPMCFALRGGVGVPGIKLLLSVGVSLDACSIHASAFFCAADSGWGAHLRTDVVKLLLEAGCCAGEGNGWTPLQRALRYCKYEVGAIKLFLDLPGVDVNGETVGWKQDTLLHLAVDNYYCDKRVVRLLINRGAEVDKVNECDDTALLLAVMNEECHPSVVDILLEKGSPVNKSNKYGKTPLGVAVETERSTVVLQLLLAAGARIGIVKDLIHISLLKLALSMYLEKQNQKRLECLKIILRYSLLENLNLASEYLMEKQVQFKTLSGFIKECEQEVREMRKKYVGRGRTLREFLAGSCQPRIATAESNPESTNYDFDQLLKITIDNDFPNYTDAISAKVGTTALNTKLQDLRMYTRECSPYIEKKIYLNYECICRISQFLSMADLLRLMSAFCVSYSRTSCEVARKDLQIEGNDGQRTKEYSKLMHKDSDHTLSEEFSSSPSHHGLSDSSPPSISNILQRKNKSMDSSCFMSDSDKLEETPLLKCNESNQKHGVGFEHSGILKPKEIVQKKRVYYEKDCCILAESGERSEPYVTAVENMKRCKVVLPTDDLRPIS